MYFAVTIFNLMQIYQSNYLEVFFDKPNDLFIQNWNDSPENSDVFKREMLSFVALYQNYNPSRALWLHQNFSFTMDKEITTWAEEFVVKPCVESGNKKLAFVVGRDVFSHLSVVESFDGVRMPTPRHFVEKKEALNWLLDDFDAPLINKKPSIYFEGVDVEGNMLIKIDSPVDTTNVLKLFKEIQRNGGFYNKNLLKFNELTGREKEILLNYINGLSAQEISDTFHISIFTVRTHWRNIKRKLAINSFVEAVNYKCFY